MDPHHHNNKKMEQGTSNSEGRWGTWVMGTPVPPQAHPVNQQAATWVAGEAIPSSDPATLNANYMKYSVPPVTGGTAGTSCYPQTNNPYIHTSPDPPVPSSYPQTNNPYVHTTPAPSSYPQTNNPYVHTTPAPSSYPQTNNPYVHTSTSPAPNSYPQTNNPYVHTSPVPGSSGKSPMEMILNVCSRWGKKFEDATRKAEGFAGDVWQHLKTSPCPTDAAMARLAQGTKVLAEGGYEKVFQQTFQILPGEKLLKAYACYLSTSSGPVIGTLYISTKKVAFCSDNPLCHYPSPGQQEWMYYKVVVPFDRLVAVNPSTNRLKPSEKYIKIVTADSHEFWFMGFISYDKAFKNLSDALQQNGAHTCGNQQT